MARDFGLPRRHGNTGAVANARHHRRIVVPMTRLFEPANVEMLDAAREIDRVGRAPAAVRIHSEHEIGAGGFARSFDALRVLCGRQSPDFELAAGHAELAIEL